MSFGCLSRARIPDDPEDEEEDAAALDPEEEDDTSLDLEEEDEASITGEAESLP